MKLKSIILAAFAALLTIPVMSACDDGPTFSSLTDTNDPLPTTVTDSLEFPYAADYATKVFGSATTGLDYGKATLVSATDGDTANFKNINGDLIKLRFLGINTPESTAKVEAWGVKASKFTYEKLTTATNICLVNDIKENPGDEEGYEKTDTSGNRHMGFIWYQETAASKWRLLNLEIVEQAYSKNQCFTDSDLRYREAFANAEKLGLEHKVRVHGAKDPDFDYSNEVIEASVYYIRRHYDELGIDAETGTSGKQLRVKGIVVGQIGDNMVIRDIVRDPNQGDEEAYETMYCYAGFNSSLASKVDIGDVVQFYCRASKYPKDSTNIQLTDIKTSSYGTKKFVVVKKDSAEWTEMVPVDLTLDPVMPGTIAEKADLAKHSGSYVQLDVTVRNVQKGDVDDEGNFIPDGEETYYNQGTSGTTIYAHVAGTKIVCNMRIDHTCSPLLTYRDFALGATYRVKAYLTPYFENYQLQLFSNVPGYGFVTEVK